MTTNTKKKSKEIFKVPFFMKSSCARGVADTKNKHATALTPTPTVWSWNYGCWEPSAEMAWLSRDSGTAVHGHQICHKSFFFFLAGTCNNQMRHCVSHATWHTLCSQRRSPRFQQKIYRPDHNENPYMRNDCNCLLMVVWAQQAAQCSGRESAATFLNYVTEKYPFPLIIVWTDENEARTAISSPKSGFYFHPGDKRGCLALSFSLMLNDR